MRTLTLIFFLFASHLLFGQQPFSKTYPGIGGGGGPDLLYDDSSYVIAPRSLSTYNVLEFIRLDVNGIMIDSARYSFSDSAYTTNCYDCLSKVNGRLYYAAVELSLWDDRTIFLKLNNDFDTLSSFRYQYDSLATQIFAMTFDTDSTFIATGNTGELVSEKHAEGNLIVVKMDTSFNIIWERKFVDSIYTNHEGGFSGWHLEVDEYGSVIIGGVAFHIGRSSGPPYTIKKSLIARLDRATGKLHWLKTFRFPLDSWYLYALDMGDGTYRYFENAVLEVYPDSTHSKKALNFGAIDTAGNILWSKLMGPYARNYTIEDVAHTPDGNMVAVGTVYKPPRNRTTGLYKISPAGDSLWYREYYYQDSTDYSWLYNITTTPDSGFAMAGFWLDRHSSTPARSWVLKVDQYGCLVEGCHTIGLPEGELAGQVEIYPNPSRGELQLKISEFPAKFQLYSSQGALVKQAELHSPENTLELGHLSPGFYTVYIKSDSGSYTQKLIIRP